MITPLSTGFTPRSFWVFSVLLIAFSAHGISQENIIYARGFGGAGPDEEGNAQLIENNSYAKATGSQTGVFAKSDTSYSPEVYDTYYADNTAHATGSVEVTYGVVHASASVSQSHSPEGAVATAEGRFNDRFTISDPTLNGQTGTLILTMQLNGVLGASYGSNRDAYRVSSYNATFTATNVFTDTLERTELSASNYYYDADDGGPVTGSNIYGYRGDDPGPMQITLSITFGQAVDIQFKLKVEARVNGQTIVDGTRYGDAATGHSDFEHTATWDALVVKDSEGNTLSGYQFSSQSGTDYRQALTAVPEPASTALLFGAVGLGFLLLRKSRREG